MKSIISSAALAEEALRATAARAARDRMRGLMILVSGWGCWLDGWLWMGKQA